jgi:hypothetical protein
MAKPSDPLTFIPSADAIRRSLSETEDRARKLRILLDVAEKIEGKPHDKAADRRELAHAG